MVRIGFIVEGTSDFIVLKSDSFINYLRHSLHLECNENLIKIARNKSFLKTDLKSLLNSLIKLETEYIFILVDQDDKEEQKRNKKYAPPDCPMVVVNEITGFRDNRHYLKAGHIFIIMVRELEAWFIADRNLGLNYTGNPEDILNPSDFISQRIGTSSHIKIANKYKDHFSIVRAANNSASAARFLRKLREINPN